MKDQEALMRELHEKAMLEKKDYYIDPATGHRVMTEQYLWERGWCCNSNCRHCPY